MQQRTRQRLLERGATAEFPLQHRIDPVGGGTKLPQRMFDALADERRGADLRSRFCQENRHADSRSRNSSTMASGTGSSAASRSMSQALAFRI